MSDGIPAWSFLCTTGPSHGALLRSRRVAKGQRSRPSPPRAHALLMQDRVAILLSPARLACAALLVWVTASIAYVTQSSPAPKIDAATDALERCARDEICGAILATP